MPLSITAYMTQIKKCYRGGSTSVQPDSRSAAQRGIRGSCIGRFAMDWLRNHLPRSDPGATRRCLDDAVFAVLLGRWVAATLRGLTAAAGPPATSREHSAGSLSDAAGSSP